MSHLARLYPPIRQKTRQNTPKPAKKGHYIFYNPPKGSTAVFYIKILRRPCEGGCDRRAQVEDELSQAEHQHDLDLDDRAERQGIAWASWVPRGLTCDEHSLLKFLRDKASGHTSAALFLYSKRRLFHMLRQGGVPEDQALQLLANYRRPFPGFYEPDDLAYAEDEEKTGQPAAPAAEQVAEAGAEQGASQDAATANTPGAGG